MSEKFKIDEVTPRDQSSLLDEKVNVKLINFNNFKKLNNFNFKYLIFKVGLK